MSTRMQSALKKTATDDGLALRAKRQTRDGDIGELLYAELAARRARLQELLGLISREVAREMKTGTPVRMSCQTVRGAARTTRAN